MTLAASEVPMHPGASADDQRGGTAWRTAAGCLLAVLAGAQAAAAEPPISIAVDAGQVLRRGADRWLGINLNYIRDADANRAPGARPLREALCDLGARWLRYPGGEKSDFHLFAAPPYAAPAPRSLGWYASCAGTRLDFDAYIATCRAVGAEPYVVVGCDNAERTGRTWDAWLEHAVAWVRYANIERRYGVRWWEIGNENWHNQTAPPAEMAAVVARFAGAMKAVDPGIRIGASGSDAAWWGAFLPAAAAHLDFLSVSVYNAWGWKSYDHILAHPEADLTGSAGTALRAIADLPSQADRDRLRVVVAETNSVDYSPGGWPRTNSLGHALITFATLGRLAAEPRIASAMLWNTRWMDDAKAGGDQFYALDAANRLLPSGWAVALWGRYLQPDLVATAGGTPLLRAFASAGAEGGTTTVWLVNLAAGPVAEVEVSVRTSATLRSAERRCLHGTGADDPAPILDGPAAIPIVGNRIAGLSCPGMSITVLSLRP